MGYTTGLGEAENSIDCGVRRCFFVGLHTSRSGHGYDLPAVASRQAKNTASRQYDYNGKREGKMKTSEIVAVWLKETALECASVLRFGVLTCFLIALALFEFRPETTGDEAAVFILVPIALFCLEIRLASLGLSHLPVREVDPKPLDFRTNFILWSVVGCIFITLVSVPSVFTFRLLGMEWAADFEMRFMSITVASVLCSVFVIGTRVSSAIRLLFSVIRIIDPPGPEKLAGRC